MKKEEISQKKQKGEKTKQKLFNTAAELFDQYDFNEVTVDRIVEAAGVAKGTFYIYFESKDELIAAFLSDYASRVDMDYRATMDTFPSDMHTSQILLSLISKISDTLTGTIGFQSMRTVYKLQLTDAIDMSAVMGYNRELYGMFSDILERGFERDEFSFRQSVEELTRHFVMAIRGLSYEWCIRYPDFDLKAQALSHFQILLDGIKSR